MKKKIITWIKAAFIRAARTVAESAVSTLTTCVVLSEVNWILLASSSAIAGLGSLLTSLVGLPEVNEITKSKWVAIAIRTIKTVAQHALALISSAIFISDVDWTMLLSSSVLAALITILMGLSTGLPETTKEA